MAEFCIFCLKKLTTFNSRPLSCCGVPQPVCRDCYDRYSPLDDQGRGKAALDTGRAVRPETIQARMEREQINAQRRAQRLERIAQRTQCCGQAMTRLDYASLQRILFPSASTTNSFSYSNATNAFLWGESIISSFRCELCGELKLFETVPQLLPEIEETTTCPVCGCEHHPDVGCPRCAMRQVEGGRVRKADWEAAQARAKDEKPRGKKPPWEK